MLPGYVMHCTSWTGLVTLVNYDKTPLQDKQKFTRLVVNPFSQWNWITLKMLIIRQLNFIYHILFFIVYKKT